jgi:hypothetical protein
MDCTPRTRAPKSTLRTTACTNGATLLEMSIAMPIIMMLVLATLDFGFFLYARNSLGHAAQRALTLATWVPGLEITDINAPQFVTALDKIKAAASTSYAKLSFGRSVALRGEPNIKYADLDTDAYKHWDHDAFVVGLPAVDAMTNSRPFGEQPIAVRINGTFTSPLLGWIVPSINIQGEARGFRELYPTSNIPIPKDCMGQPYNPPRSQVPSADECCARNHNDASDPCCQQGAEVSPLTGQCGDGCPAHYKAVTNTATNKHYCECDINSLGCPRDIVDMVHCACTGRQCSSYHVRRDDNTCGCASDKSTAYPDHLIPANCHWDAPGYCRWTADGYKCKNAWLPSYTNQNIGIDFHPENGVENCQCPGVEREFYNYECGCWCHYGTKASDPNDNTSDCVVDCGAEAHKGAGQWECLCNNTNLPPPPNGTSACPGNKIIDGPSYTCICKCPAGMEENPPGSDNCGCKNGQVPVDNKGDWRVGCCANNCPAGFLPAMIGNGNCGCECPKCYANVNGQCVKTEGTGTEGGSATNCS